MRAASSGRRRCQCVRRGEVAQRSASGAASVPGRAAPPRARSCAVTVGALAGRRWRARPGTPSRSPAARAARARAAPSTARRRPPPRARRGARGERHLGDRRPDQVREVAVRCAPAARRRALLSARLRRGAGSRALERVVEAHQLEALTLALVDDRAQPGDALIPPVAEQLGVERAHDQPTARQRPSRGAARLPRAGARACARRSRRRARARAPAPRRGRTARPSLLHGLWWWIGVVVVVAVGAARRVAVARPTPATIVARSIGTSSTPSSLAQRAQVPARAEPEAARQLDAGRRARRRPRARAPTTAHTRTPAARSRRASARRSGARWAAMPAHLQAHARVGGEQRQDRVRRRGGPLRVARERGRAGRRRSRAGARARRSYSPAERSSSRASSSCPPARSPRASLGVGLAAHPRRNCGKRSSTPGASSWSHRTGVSDSVSGAPCVEHSSSGR